MRRALIVATGGGLGDLLLASPIGEALARAFPGIAITWWANARAASILGGNPHVAALWTESPRAPIRVLLDATRGGRYDIAVLPWTTGRQASLAWLARIPCRVGQGGRLAYSWMFTHRVRVRSAHGDTTSHWVDIQLDYARAVGCDATGVAPRIWLTDEDREAARRVLQARGIRAADRFCVLHVGRDLPIATLAWNVERLAEIGRGVSSRHGLHVVLTGTDAEKSVIARAANGIGKAAISLAGETPGVRCLAAVVERAALFVGLDSGPMHVAAALGVPVLGIFALESDMPARWGPYATASRIVRTGAWRCPLKCVKEQCRHFECLSRIDVGGAMRAADELLGGAAVAGGAPAERESGAEPNGV